jgi:hypothetical protein
VRKFNDINKIKLEDRSLKNFKTYRSGAGMSTLEKDDKLQFSNPFKNAEKFKVQSLKFTK